MSIIGFGWKDVIGLKDLLGSQINPATEDKQDDIISGLGGSTSIGDGTATVVSAGTAVQLSDVSVRKVIIQAHESNAGTVVIGGSNVVAALVGRRGVALFPTQSQAFQVDNLNKLYIDSTESSDKVNYYYEI